MKRLRYAALGLILILSSTTSAFAAEVPDSLVVENLNGQQRMVKTYVLAPDADPDTLKEPSFDYDGFHYTWAYTTKEEQPYLDTKAVTETVTVETAKNDLSQILAELSPSIAYNKDGYTGELTLDHTTLVTEAAGYTTKYSTITDTKVIGNLDRNDMSYVPATTTKNGTTLSLVDVEWQVTGTDLVGEALVPSRYQAVATYSASSSYSVATGYVTTADYSGEVTAEGIESVTYTVVYTGAEIVPVEVEVDPPGTDFSLPSGAVIATSGGILLAILLGVLTFWLLQRRKTVFLYIPDVRPNDYKLVAKFRVTPEKPEIDITGADTENSATVAVEIKRSLAKKLVGQVFIVHHAFGTHQYPITQDRRDDWHEFTLKEEAALCETEETESSVD